MEREAGNHVTRHDSAYIQWWGRDAWLILAIVVLFRLCITRKGSQLHGVFEAVMSVAHFIFTYPAVPLFFFALTLLCPFPLFRLPLTPSTGDTSLPEATIFLSGVMP